MSYKFLTPLQVWEGFNPVKEPLEVSYVKSTDEGDVHISDMFYTVETVADGKIRGYIRLVFKNSWLENGERHAAVALLPARDRVETEIVKIILDEGYVAALVDYTGESPDKLFCTTYPKSLSYGNLKQAGEHLQKVTESSRDTCFYLWTKVARRAITLLTQQPAVDPSKICIIGEKQGAQTAWQVAGTDGRLHACVPVLGGGYTEYEGKFKYSHANAIEMTEERKCWLAGSAPQAYAQFITCPVYFLTGTNSDCTDFDRAYDILQLVKNQEAVMMACPMANRQMSLAAIDSLGEWLKENLVGEGASHDVPEISFEVTGGKLYVNVGGSENAVSYRAFYAMGCEDPTGRNWRIIEQSAMTGENRYMYEIPVYDADERIFAFADITFSDGVTVTSKVVTCVPKNEKVTVLAVTKGNLEERVIYDVSSGKDAFIVESKQVFSREGMLKIKEGPCGLKGMTAEEGRLVTYKLQESEFSKNKASIIQLHAYCAEKRTIEFCVTLGSDTAAYVASVELNCLGKWQRITLNVGDFKTTTMRTLKEWSNVKKLEIVNAENVLFNNFLWV